MAINHFTINTTVVYVCMWTNPSHFSEFSKHNYYSGIMFPKHSPVIFNCLSQRPLSRNIRPLLPRVMRRKLKLQELRFSPAFLQMLMCACFVDVLFYFLLINIYIKRDHNVPVAIYKTAIDIIWALHSSDWLQTHTCGLIWHDIDQSVFELIARKAGTDESGVMRFGIS